MIDLAVVRAPHQVLYVAERLIDSNHKKVIVLDMYNSQNINNTISEAMKFGKWDLIIKLNYKAKGFVNLCKYLGYMCWLKALSLMRVKIANLIIGDGNILFGKVIADNFKYVNRVVLIADGNDFIYNSDSTENISYRCTVGKKAKLALKMLGFKFSEEHRFDELFTFYKVRDTRLVNNELSYLKRLALNPGFTSDSQNIYFLGSPLLGKIESQSLKKVYKKVFSRLPDDRIIYLPHRRENCEQISIVKSFKGVRVIENNTNIIETYFLSNQIIPVLLGSFVSNACFSLATIYPDIKIKMFGLRFPTEQLSEMDMRFFRYMNDLKDDRIQFNVINATCCIGES